MLVVHIGSCVSCLHGVCDAVCCGSCSFPDLLCCLQPGMLQITRGNNSKLIDNLVYETIFNIVKCWCEVSSKYYTLHAEKACPELVSGFQHLTCSWENYTAVDQQFIRPTDQVRCRR